MKIQQNLHQLLDSVPGLNTILILDPVYATVVKVGDEIRNQIGLMSATKSVVDQVKKFSLGSFKSLSLIYNSKQIIVLRVDILTVFLIAEISVNGYYLIQLRDQLQPIVEECIKASDILRDFEQDKISFPF
uniref:Robl_LC7 domain-containing protein n=1 Tax=Rhabditophanes sp. KR3021 TaxID=114890 RepID=A0AC35TGI2_9BILA